MSGTCPNCGEARGADDVFCEHCGFDFLTGSLPTPDQAVTALPTATQDIEVEVATRVRFTADRAYHERMDADGVLTFPEPPPPERELPVTGAEVLIGRARPSRGLFPDIDLSSDPAVSSRHAALHRRADGSWTITDLGSTNGTYLGNSTVALEPGVAVTIGPDTDVHLGAWTRLTLVHAPLAQEAS